MGNSQSNQHPSHRATNAKPFLRKRSASAIFSRIHLQFDSSSKSSFEPSQSQLVISEKAALVNHDSRQQSSILPLAYNPTYSNLEAEAEVAMQSFLRQFPGEYPL